MRECRRLRLRQTKTATCNATVGGVAHGDSRILSLLNRSAKKRRDAPCDGWARGGFRRSGCRSYLRRRSHGRSLGRYSRRHLAMLSGGTRRFLPESWVSKLRRHRSRLLTTTQCCCLPAQEGSGVRHLTVKGCRRGGRL